LKGNHALGLMRFAEENKHKDKEKIAVNNDWFVIVATVLWCARFEEWLSWKHERISWWETSQLHAGAAVLYRTMTMLRVLYINVQV
jgi:hypothetical protein